MLNAACKDTPVSLFSFLSTKIGEIPRRLAVGSYLSLSLGDKMATCNIKLSSAVSSESEREREIARATFGGESLSGESLPSSSVASDVNVIYQSCN